MREPRVGGPPASATPPAERLALRYPDGAHDAETLLVDPASGALVIVRKDPGAVAGVYVAERPSAASVTVMRRAGRVEALALTRDGSAFYTVPEGRRPALRRYAAVRAGA